MDEDLEGPHPLFYSSDFDSACSTPYVSAPSSPGRSSSAASSSSGGGYFYSAPTSPMHTFLISSKQPKPKPCSTEPSLSSNSEFEFSARFSGEPSPAVSSADELFLNGQIRPMKLKSHLLNPQRLAPLIDLDEPDPDPETRESNVRGRVGKPSRRRTRSMSPLRKSMTWHRIKKEDGDNVDSMEKCGIKEEDEEEDEEEVVASMSASSSRSSSGGRSSKRWIFLKEFLYRSKSEGRNNNNNNNNNSNGTNSSSKIWSKFSFSPVKAKKPAEAVVVAEATVVSSLSTDSLSTMGKESVTVKKKVGPTNGGAGKRRVHLSAHEMHYKANRAQSEEMRKKTFLPYRQGLIGCLGFSSKGYGAVNGLARALNPVSSR